MSFKKEKSLTYYPDSEESYGDEEESVIFAIEDLLGANGLMGTCGVDTYPKAYVPNKEDNNKYSMQGTFQWVEDPSDKQDSPTAAWGYFYAGFSYIGDPNNEQVNFDVVEIDFDEMDIPRIKDVCNIG